MKMKRLIARLIEWMSARGFDAKDIIDCMRYITQ
jgi:hypothetical protein